MEQKRMTDQEDPLLEATLAAFFQQQSAAVSWATQVPLPEELEEEVFATLDSMQLVGDLLDLFTGKFLQSKWVVLQAMAQADEDGSKKPY